LDHVSSERRNTRRGVEICHSSCSSKFWPLLLWSHLEDVRSDRLFWADAASNSASVQLTHSMTLTLMRNGKLTNMGKYTWSHFLTFYTEYGLNPMEPSRYAWTFTPTPEVLTVSKQMCPLPVIKVTSTRETKSSQKVTQCAGKINSIWRTSTFRGLTTTH